MKEGEGRGGEGGNSSRTRRRSHNAALTTEFTPERLRIDQNQRLESTKDLSGTSRDPPGTPPPPWDQTEDPPRHPKQEKAKKL